MAHRVKFERKAREVLDECGSVYPPLGQAIEKWLAALASVPS